MTFPWDALCATWLFPLSDCFHLFKCPHGNSINWISEGHMYALLSLCTMEVVGFGSAFPYWDDRVYFSVVRLAIMNKSYKNKRWIWIWEMVLVSQICTCGMLCIHLAALSSLSPFSVPIWVFPFVQHIAQMGSFGFSERLQTALFCLW